MNSKLLIAGCMAVSTSSIPAWGQTPTAATENEPVAPIESLIPSAEPRPSILERITALTTAQRANATIDIELSEHATPADHEMALAAADAWNSGASDDALAQIASLQDGGVLAGVGVQWGDAQPTGDDATRAGFSTARRIGNPRTDADEVMLIEDSVTGFLFAVVAWDNGDWTLNRSVNGGLSWSERFFWAGLNSAPAVDITAADDYVYVAYRTGVALFEPDHEVRLRRFTQVGDSDATYTPQTLFSGATEYTDVALVSSRDESFAHSELIYCMATDEDGLIYYGFDTASDGMTFSTVNTGSGDAVHGIDLTFKPGPSAPFLYASFVDSLNRVHILRRGGPGDWLNTIIDHDYIGASHQTSISAWDDAVVCAYESNAFGVVTTAKYEITLNDSVSWQPGTIAATLGQDYFRPDVTLRGGFGIGAVFLGDLPGSDSIGFRSRPGLGGAWGQVQESNAIDTWLPSKPHIEAISPSILSPASLYAYGMTFVGDNDLNAYFYRWDHCVGDTDGDGVIGLTDLAELLSRFGAADVEQGEASDLNGDGAVDISDLATMLSLYGSGC